MGVLWTYTILLGIIAIISIRKRWNYTGKTLIFLYLIISIFSLLVPTRGQIAYVRKLDPSTISYGMIIFLVICYIILFSPFFKKREVFSPSKMSIALNRNYYIFGAIYILMCVITIVLYTKPLMQIIVSGRWAINRALMTSTEAVYPYHNFIEKIIINFTSYFKILALIVGLLIISNDKKKRLGYLLIVMTTICEAFVDLYVSSRGMLATYFLYFFALILFFFPELSKSNRRTFIALGILAAIIIVPYMIDITINRFSDSSTSSLIYYFGQPPYGFAAEVKGLNHYMHGRFAFGTLIGDDKFPIELSGWVRAFYTIVGWMYADWGYIGTIIIGLIISVYFNIKTNKNIYYMSDIFIIFSYYKLLIDGVFTVGRTTSYMIIASLVIYFMLKYVIDRVRFKIG